jgi:two-component system NtrC family sensor kinase
MTVPPSSELALLQRAAAFGRALAGTLRRASIVDLLFAHIRDAIAPSEVTVGLLDRDTDSVETLRTEPTARPDRQALLELAARRGAVLAAGDLAGRLEEAGLPVPEDLSGSWCIVPLVAKTRVTGAVAVRSGARELAAADLALLEALAAQAGVALESARLVDLHDDGRRSWQEVVDALSLAICIVDPSGRIRRANRAFAELVDAPPATLVGRPWNAFAPPDWAAELGKIIDAAAPDRTATLRTGDRAYEVGAVPINEADRSAVVVLFDDRTEERRLQEQLVQSEKMSAIGQLIAGIAHDLNNPLASVVGFADFLGELPDVPPQLREPLSVIREEAERASSIVKNLLGFARKQEGQRRPTPLGPLLDATFVLLRNQLLASRIEARVEVDPELPLVDIDPNQIQQVFVNLINNAQQAIASTGRAGAVMVTARRTADGVAVDVRDDGPGMSSELAAHVFDPFFTTKPEGQGTGLGLSISVGIVKEHGGRITLSTEEGRGATFTVHLPLTASEAAPDAAAPATRAAVPRLRVLVVDDEPHILHYMRATLETWGHEVATATDGDEALARAAGEPFDLVISDLRMPRLGGREFYEELMRRDPAAARRLVFSTGDTVRGDTLRFLEKLDRPYLHKPFSLTELRTLLASVAREASETSRGG